MNTEYMIKDYTPKGECYSVSITKWNKTFAKRGSFPFTKVFVFVDEKGANSVYVPTVFAKVLLLLLFPILFQAYLITGKGKEFIKESKGFLFPLRNGHFGSDYILRTSDSWAKIVDLIGLKEKNT